MKKWIFLLLLPVAALAQPGSRHDDCSSVLKDYRELNQYRPSADKLDVTGKKLLLAINGIDPSSDCYLKKKKQFVWMKYELYWLVAINTTNELDRLHYLDSAAQWLLQNRSSDLWNSNAAFPTGSDVNRLAEMIFYQRAESCWKLKDSVNCCDCPEILKSYFDRQLTVSTIDTVTKQPAKVVSDTISPNNEKQLSVFDSFGQLVVDSSFAVTDTQLHYFDKLLPTLVGRIQTFLAREELVTDDYFDVPPAKKNGREIDSCIVQILVEERVIKEIKLLSKSSKYSNGFMKLAAYTSIYFMGVNGSNDWFLPLKFRWGTGRTYLENGWIVMELICPEPLKLH
jgi:hypothetical protein